MAIPGMEDYPIKVGSLLFTMVEPEKGHEVEYNRWYEHDHFYSGCMVGKWQFAGNAVFGGGSGTGAANYGATIAALRRRAVDAQQVRA